MGKLNRFTINGDGVVGFNRVAKPTLDKPKIAVVVSDE